LLPWYFSQNNVPSNPSFSAFIFTSVNLQFLPVHSQWHNLFKVTVASCCPSSCPHFPTPLPQRCKWQGLSKFNWYLQTKCFCISEDCKLHMIIW
jgi:hypothetical protein